MKKLLFSVCAFVTCISIGFAQISTGSPTSRVFKTGNRPDAGTYGVYLGVSSTMFQGFNDPTIDNVDVEGLPLINFKYMFTDNIEFRVGIENYKKSAYTKGRIDNDKKEGSSAMMNKHVESSCVIYPGAAYRFSPTNLLDVYVGAELPLGWDNDITKAAYAYDNGNTLNENSSSDIKRSFNVGLGVFVGLQAFIADLPIALGAEFGLMSRYDLNAKFKHIDVYTDPKTNETVKQVYYTLTNEPGTTQYTKLNHRTGELGSQARFTLTYYFK